MTLAHSPSKSLRLADTSHPRFVGLAHLRSLLAHQDVASDSHRSDAVLDLIGLLLRDAPASAVVRSFCVVRRACSQVCYLAIFRLRRWLEQQIVVKTGDGQWQPLTLAFQDFRRVEQSYRRDAWESSEVGSEWSNTSVDFAWNCPEWVHSEDLAEAIA